MATSGSVTSRRVLQVVMALLATIPLGTGLLDVLVGPAALPTRPQVDDPNLDSTYRFLGVMWLSAGALWCWIIPRVERAGGPLRAIAAALFAGGCARALSAAVVGVPHPMLVAVTVLELVAPPVLVLWQARVAAQAPLQRTTRSS